MIANELSISSVVALRTSISLYNYMNYILLSLSCVAAAVALAPATALAQALGSGSQIAHGGETTTQTVPVWDDDKETMGRKIYNTSNPTEF